MPKNFGFDTSAIDADINITTINKDSRVEAVLKLVGKLCAINHSVNSTAQYIETEEEKDSSFR